MPTPRRASHRAPRQPPSHLRAPRRSPRRGSWRALLLPGLLIAGCARRARRGRRRHVPLHRPAGQGRDVDKAVSRGAASGPAGRRTNVFKHAVKGYATKPHRAERRRLAKDPAVEAIVPDSVVAAHGPGHARRHQAGPRDGRAGHPHRRRRRRAATGSTPTSRSSTPASRPAIPTSTSSAASTARARAVPARGATATATGPTSRASPRPSTTASAWWARRPAPGCGRSGSSGPTATRCISWIVCGIDWVTAQRDPNDPSQPLIEVANMSLRDEGGDDRQLRLHRTTIPEHRAICASVAAGITYVVAAGNDCRRRPAPGDPPRTTRSSRCRRSPTSTASPGSKASRDVHVVRAPGRRRHVRRLLEPRLRRRHHRARRVRPVDVQGQHLRHDLGHVDGIAGRRRCRGRVQGAPPGRLAGAGPAGPPGGWLVRLAHDHRPRRRPRSAARHVHVRREPGLHWSGRR